MMIRTTAEADEAALRNVHECAFDGEPGRVIADLTLALLSDPTAEPVLSLAATENEAIVGHVLFTAVRISGPAQSVTASILAPLAVLPERQRQGVGARLVEEGLRRLAESGCELVFVLGHPEYYPRFGFQPSGCHGLDAPYPIPEKNSDAWMVLELAEGRIGSVRGTVQCADALCDPTHWRE